MSLGVSAKKTLRKLKELQFSHVLMIPDSESRLLYEVLEKETSIELITPCREGESIAIAAGLWTGGCNPLIVIQNTGLMEAGDSLRGCGMGQHVPLRMIIGWRGYGGAMSNKLPIDSAYTYTEPLLNGWGIPYWNLMQDDDLEVMGKMNKTAEETSMPAAVITGYTFKE